MKILIPWLIAIAEFGIIIFLLNNMVTASPDFDEEEDLEPIKTTSEEESPRVVSPPPPTDPVTASSTPSTASEPRFKEGDQLALSSNVKLREKPNGDQLKVLTTEETLTVKEGPLSEAGSLWWKVEVTGTPESRSGAYLGLTGYVADGEWLVKK